jgi:hypothetical protein
MKHIYTSLLFLASFMAAYAQSVNKAFQEYNDYGAHLTEVNGNFYFTTNISTPAFQDEFNVSSLDASGNLRFRKVLNKNEYTVPTRMIRTMDKKIALIGYGNGCDFLDPNAKTFLIKLDENGSILFDNSFTHLNNGMPDYLKDLVQYNDSSYYAITDSVLFHFSKNGALIRKKRTGFSGLRGLKERPDGKLLISQGSSSFKLIVMDTSTTLINQYTINANSANALVKNNHTIYTLNGTLQKRNSSMQVTSTSTAAQGNGILTNYRLLNDTIYACGYNTNTTSFVVLMDTSLNLLTYIGDTTRSISPTSIIPTEDRIALLTNCKSQPANNGIIGFSSFPKNSDYHFTEDIGVTGCNIDSARATFFYSAQQNTYYTNYQYYRLKFIIKNYGTAPVSSFKVNSLINNPLICGTDYYSEQFNTPAIAPGASHTVTSRWIAHYANAAAGAMGQTVVINGNLCFNTSRPNGANDAAILNDSYCANITFSETVTALEELQEGPTLSVFPNPTRELINIQCSSPMQEISISDVSGRLIQTLEIQDSLEQELNVNGLSAGIYFIRIESGKGITTRKFVKQ